MFGWSKGKKEKGGMPDALIFKSNNAAFEYAAKYIKRPLVNEAIIFGQVVSKSSSSPLEKWRVRLATEHGIVETEHCGSIAKSIASKVNLESTPIQEGDLVAVQVAAYDPKFAVDHMMQYFIVITKLKPELCTKTHILLPETTVNK